MRRVATALLALFVLTAIPFALPRLAAACGGCFAPTGTPNIVTAHRMAVSLSATETTLWDQIQYAGAPADFVWVLPVAPGVEVQLADNAFFEALAQGTQLNLIAPLPPTRTRRYVPANQPGKHREEEMSRWIPKPLNPPSRRRQGLR